jgi:hypothetical protein
MAVLLYKPEISKSSNSIVKIQYCTLYSIALNFKRSLQYKNCIIYCNCSCHFMHTAATPKETQLWWDMSQIFTFFLQP